LYLHPLRIANCELRIANCELRIANCELRIANCEAPAEEGGVGFRKSSV
jgi:hypothetical protein